MSESVLKGLPKRFKGLSRFMFVMIAGIGAVITSQLLRTSPPPTVAPPPIQAVTALGRLEPKGEVIQLSAPNQGSRVGQLLVKVGDRVRKGQVMAYLDTRDRAAASVEQALEQVKVQQTRLAIVKAGAKTGEIQAQSATVERVRAQLQEELAARDATISRIQAELQNAAREYKRYQFLQIEGAVSASLRDDKKLALDVAQQRLNEAKANRRQTEETLVKQIKEARSTLSKIAEVRPVDVMAAQAEVDRAKAAVKQARAELDLAVIKAPRDGQILRVNTWAGEIIDTKKGVVSLGETSQMYAVAEVYETDLPRIRAGQKATISSVSGGVLTEPIAGVVDEIGLEVMKKDVLNTDPAAEIDARVVEVKIRLNAADSQKVAGFSNMKLKVAINLMKMKRKLPIAWLQLKKEKSRMFVAIAGIAFADVLMFLQMGFRSALFNGAVQIHNVLDGEIFLVSRRYKSLISLDRFSERRLYQALGYTGVKSVSPIYLSPVQWKNPENKQIWNLYAIGFNPNDRTLKLPGVQANLEQLKRPDTVMFDAGARREFGDIPKLFKEQGVFSTEVENRRVDVIGLFKLGTSFGINGHLVTSDINFLRLFGERRQKGLIDMGVIKLEPTANTAWVLANLRARLPSDVLVISKQEFLDKEKGFWNSSTPVGYVFDLGAVIGFMVGAVIVYQILYSDVSDHLAEYATLKAIGFRDRYLLSVVFTEAMILAAMGFIPGLGISLGFYSITRQATLLPMVMTVGRAIFVLTLTGLMCGISAAIAIRKLQSADPADIF